MTLLPLLRVGSLCSSSGVLGKVNLPSKPSVVNKWTFIIARLCRHTNNFTQETEWLILFIISASLPYPPNSIPNNCEVVSPIPRNSPMEQRYWSTNTTEPYAFFQTEWKRGEKTTPDLHPCNLFTKLKTEMDWKHRVTSEKGMGTRVTVTFHEWNIIPDKWS